MAESFLMGPLLLFFSTFSSGIPLGLPPAAEDPLLAKIAPDEYLAYVSWAGSDSPDAASTNELEKLLANPEVQFMFAEIDRMIGKDETVRIAHKILTRPTAVFVSKKDDGFPVEAGLVINLGKDVDLFHKLWAQLKPSLPDVKEVQIGGAAMYRSEEDDDFPITIGVKGEYLFVGIGEGVVEGILERAATPAPKWYTTLTEQVVVKRPSTRVYINADSGNELVPALMGFQDVSPVLNAVGIGNLQSIAMVSGLDEKGFVSKTQVAFDGELTGLMASMVGQPLSAEDLKPIPRNAMFAVASRFEAAKIFDAAIKTADQIMPGSGDAFAGELVRMNEQIGFKVREDLIEGLGDVLYLYHSPGEGGMLQGFCLASTVADREKLSRVLDAFSAMLKAEAERYARGSRNHFALKSMQFEGETIHFYERRDVPFTPSWCLTEKELVIGFAPQSIKAYLARGPDYQSLASVPEVAAVFAEGNGPIKIGYQNTPELFDLVYPLITMGANTIANGLREEGIDFEPAMLPSGRSIKKHLRPDVITVSKTDAGLEITNRQCVPGSSSLMVVGPMLVLGTTVGGIDPDDLIDGVGFLAAPSKAREMQSKNNLKQIGLGMLNHEDVYRKMPPAFSVDDDGNPLLSWRVHILPFMEQDNLYRRFKLDEPWDSEHNKALIPLMPTSYHAPGSKHAQDSGMTNYVTIRTAGSVFPGEESTNLGMIVDGTSNTIGAIEVSDAKAVIWTKPDDFVPDEMDPRRGIMGLRKEKFLCVFVDCSTRAFRSDIDPKLLANLFDRADKNPIRFRELMRWDADMRGRGRNAVAVEEFEDVESIPDSIEPEREIVPDEDFEKEKRP